MPELPEVETIKRGLSKFCIQKRINRVEVRCDKSFIGPKELIEGAKIVGIRRFGKALVFDFDNSVSMMVHLRMTGQLIYRSEGKEAGADIMEVAKNQSLGDDDTFAGGHPTDSFFAALPNKQTRVIFEMSGGGNATHDGGDARHSREKNDASGTLYFNDQRKFGFCKVIPTVEVEDDSFIKSLASEPWDIDVDEFYQKLQRRKSSAIKAVILDQKVICGLGNIYADEALFDAKIHPETPAGNLSREQAEQLVKSAQKVMEASINSGGSTMATYVRADGTKGDYLEKFAQVFRREGGPCVRCGAEIKKIRVAGRGTHYCENCQKLQMRDGRGQCDKLEQAAMTEQGDKQGDKKRQRGQND